MIDCYKIMKFSNMPLSLRVRKNLKAYCTSHCCTELIIETTGDSMKYGLGKPDTLTLTKRLNDKGYCVNWGPYVVTGGKMKGIGRLGWAPYWFKKFICKLANKYFCWKYGCEVLDIKGIPKRCTYCSKTKH